MAVRPAFVPSTLTPLEQLRAGKLARRIPQLLVGLCLYGWSMAMMIESDLGSTRGTSSTRGCRSIFR